MKLYRIEMAAEAAEADDVENEHLEQAEPEGEPKKSVADLKCGGYLDLYLVHWPCPDGKHIAAYRALEPFVGEGDDKPIRNLGHICMLTFFFLQLYLFL